MKPFDNIHERVSEIERMIFACKVLDWQLIKVIIDCSFQTNKPISNDNERLAWTSAKCSFVVRPDKVNPECSWQKQITPLSNGDFSVDSDQLLDLFVGRPAIFKTNL